MKQRESGFLVLGSWSRVAGALVRLGLVLGLGALLPAAGAAEHVTNSVSLLPNGGFEQVDPADPSKPAHWDKLDGLGVQWVQAEGSGSGKAIRMDTAQTEKAMVAQWRLKGIDKWDVPGATGDPIAATYGLSYYSDPISVQIGQAYRISFRWQGASGGIKVWVRGYGQLKGEERRLYDTIVNGRGGKEWTAQTQTFHPTRRTPAVTYVRVMLFAYWPPGVYWFDDVVITPVPMSEWEAEAGLSATNPPTAQVPPAPAP